MLKPKILPLIRNITRGIMIMKLIMGNMEPTMKKVYTAITVNSVKYITNICILKCIYIYNVCIWIYCR